MGCSTFYPSGLGACKAFREKVIGTLIVEKGNAMSVANSKLLASWTTLFADKTAGVKAIYVPFTRGYQNNTAEPTITASNLGYSEKTFDSPPLIKGMGTMSYADYKTFFGADTKEFDFFLVLRDGSLEGTLTSTGTIKGYRGTMFVTYNAPIDNVQEAFPFTISFQDITEWKEASTTVIPQFSVTDLLDEIPVGLNVEVTTAYAVGGDVTVKVTKRNESKSPYAGLTTTAKWEVLFVSADLDVDVTAVDATSAAQGIYILTIQKDSSSSAADLTDDVIIRGEDDDSTNYTYLTQPVTIIV